MTAVQKRFVYEVQTEASRFKDFASIPQECLNTANIMLWMESVFKKTGTNPSKLLPQIPKQYITDELLKRAIDLSSSSLGEIKPSDTDDYLGLVLHALKSFNYLAWCFVDESYRTQATLDVLIENEVRIGLEDPSTEWIKPLLNQQRIDRISAYNYEFALDVGLDKVSWEIVKTLLAKQPGGYKDLDLQGDLHYLSRMLAENVWPEPIRGFQYRPLENLADGVSRFMKTEINKPPTYYLFKAYVMSFPVDQVIAAMKTPVRRKVLLELYPTEVLRKHSGGDRELRGRLLEDEIGL
jgi:hypothetical protein